MTSPSAGPSTAHPPRTIRRPLFEEMPDLSPPPYMLVVSFGLVPITPVNGAIEIAPARIA